MPLPKKTIGLRLRTPKQTTMRVNAKQIREAKKLALKHYKTRRVSSEQAMDFLLKKANECHDGRHC